MRLKWKNLYVLVMISISAIILTGCMGWFFKDRNTIHIAMVGPLSGPDASVGKSFSQGIHLYVDMINEQGGVNGKKIVIDQYDDQNNIMEAQQRAYDIVDEKKAVAVIGHHYSTCSIAAGQIYKEYQIPAITPASSNVLVTENNDWYFRSFFNDNLQGRFLAGYAQKVLKADKISIIHEDQAYGAYLARVIEETSRSIGMKVMYKWGFKKNDPNVDQDLEKIVSELENKKDAGVIFLTTHATEGARLVQLMKDASLQNPIMAPDAFASKKFQQAFLDLHKERNNPGHYTNGMYVTTPLIFDTTNEIGLKFRDAYEDKYGEEPGWHAAFAYDTVLVIIDAIKKTGVKGNTDKIKEDRAGIRNYLANLIDIHDAIEGVTGYNYFDEKGDSQKPIFIGVYRNQNIISALTQFRAVPNIHEIPNFEKSWKEGRIVMFDDRYSYKINVVYTGIKVNKISEFKPDEHTFIMDFYLWFRYHGGIDVKHIEFLNAAEPIHLGEPAYEKVEDQLTYRLYHVKGRFRSDFIPNLHIFGQHLLGVSFRSRGLDRNNLIFVKDVLGMRLTKGMTPNVKMEKDQVLRAIPGWRIDQVWFFQDISEKDSLGDPSHFNLRAGTLEYSRFNVGIRIKEDLFTIRRVIPGSWSIYLLVISFIISIFLAYSVKKGIRFGPLPNLKSISKLVWFFQVFFAFVFILSAEVYLLEVLSGHLTQFFYDQILLSFDVIWWLAPAYYLALGVDRFIWVPIEIRTGRYIPNIIRRMVFLFIYLLALFGVVAFVFDQKLTSLLATSGVIAMIVGLAIQINIANIFSGIAINLERPFRIDDWVKIGDYAEGKVLDINWRATRIKTRDDTVLTIPNSKASESPITNFSYPTTGYFKYFTIHVDPIHSPERVKKVLLDAALATEGVSNDPPPATRFLGLTEGMTGQSESWAANYLIGVYVNDYGMKFAHNEAIWLNVWTHLKHAGIRHVMERREVLMTVEGVKRKEARVNKTLNILNEMDIFQPFSLDSKRYISQKMRRQYYTPGDIVVRQGDAGDSLFIVDEGALGVWTKLRDGKSIEIARLGAGNFFGEMALLTGEPRSATIVAITDTFCYEITKMDVLPLLEDQPELFYPLSDVLSERKMATEYQKNIQTEQRMDKTTLSTQILNKIQSFFGFKKS